MIKRDVDLALTIPAFILLSPVLPGIAAAIHYVRSPAGRDYLVRGEGTMAEFNPQIVQIHFWNRSACVPVRSKMIRSASVW
jgi:hypothetical protein